jgi:endonuclease G
MKRCIVVRLLLVGFLLAGPFSPALAQDGAAPPRIYCKHFIFGYPQGAPAANPMIIRDLYALSLNGRTKLADWVCYYLTPHETTGTLDLERKWRNEPWVQPGEALQASPRDDYRGAGSQQYDRGHMAPLASFKGSRYASQVNLYSNIMPQKAALNEGPWKNLEDKVRGLVDTYGQVWAMSGPLYERDLPPLAQAQRPHKVPSGFWMIVAAPGEGYARNPKDLRVAAFIMDQDTPRTASFQDFLVSVAEVENRSKLNFFGELSAAEQQNLEAQKSTAWVREWLE